MVLIDLMKCCICFFQIIKDSVRWLKLVNSRVVATIGLRWNLERDDVKIHKIITQENGNKFFKNVYCLLDNSKTKRIIDL